MSSAVTALLMLLSGGPVGVADAAVTATQISDASAIKIDGSLTDAAWARATTITGFLQREPSDGKSATFETEARVVYDQSSLYVAVRAFDAQPERLVGFRTRRDEHSPSDWIRVLVDSFHDRRTAFEFAVNPAGVKQDTYWFDDGNADSGWDAVWEVEVSRSADGWQAEFRIPFSQLRFQPSAGATFGLAFVRQIGRLNETTTWPLLSRQVSGYVSQFGRLNGLQLARSPKRLELVPYVVGGLTTQQVQASDPLQRPNDPNAAMGLDLKFALKPGLTVTGTVNPDFGQVEADPAVVNLSAFETFFSERRPFFLEGAGIFRFDVDCNDGECSGLFYSRRVGRQPRRSLDLADGAYSSSPTQTTIVGASKLSGRVGSFSVGALNAITADEHARIVDDTGHRRETVEPLTSYSVVRARREFADQSAVGLMFTATNRRLDSFTQSTPGGAYTGGVDWNWRLGRRYAFQGYWAGSSVRGEAEAIAALQESNVHSYQRPDATHVTYDPERTSLNGYGAQAALSKIGGQRVRFTSSVTVKSPGFDINDVGFLRRADQQSVSNWLQWRHEEPSKYLRTFRFNLNQWAGWNYGGDLLDSGGNVNAHAFFANNWGAGGGFTVNARRLDDRATRGGPGAYQNGQKSMWTYVHTDNRFPVSANVNISRSGDGLGSRYRDVSPSLTWRPSASLMVNGGLRFSSNHDDSQWIEESDGRYVFGRLVQKTVGLRVRFNYTIAPNLTVQMYAEPFVSAGEYSNFKELVDGRARSYAERYDPVAYTRDPDFNYRSFRTTNVLRWEYAPGSTLFIVWQQGREDTLEHGTFSFHRDFGGVFDAPARNVFLVKWAYWMNY